MTSRQTVDINALASLARIELAESEKQELESQIPDILAFVASIQGVSAASNAPQAPRHKNIMREDEVLHEPGAYTETLLSAAPHREKNHLKVSQVLKGGKHT